MKHIIASAAMALISVVSLNALATSPASCPDFTRAAESTINGVVSIKSFVNPVASSPYGGSNRNRQATPDFFNDPFFEFFFGQPSMPNDSRRQQRQPRRQGRNSDSESNGQQLRQSGLGSGVIISSDGYIVTNNHVIDGADKLEVTLNDTRQFTASVIGTDPDTDLALIKIQADSLPVIPFADSDSLRIGQWVLAVGNPFGLTSTVTAGIVSAKARRISDPAGQRGLDIESYIQTDAAVNPGNSGGALVNLNGELVGINAAIYSQTGSFTGYSFAIPTSIVLKVTTDLRQFGTVQRAVLGISFLQLNATMAREKGITAVNDGLIVMSVNERSAALEAGLKEGDVITAINGTSVHTTAQFIEQIARFRPGDAVLLSYIRNNHPYTTTVVFRNSQGSTKLSSAPSVDALGCRMLPITDALKQMLHINGGLQITELSDGLFAKAGIRAGFIIRRINNENITRPADVERIFKEISESDSYERVMFISGIYPNGRTAHYAVALDD